MLVIPVLIFLISLTLRIWNIAYPINVDEALWMFRGATFIRRILEGNFAETYLRHHPGVTNMWLIGIGNLLSSKIHSFFPNLLGVSEVPYLHSCFHSYSCPISLWIAPRLLQGLVTSACMVGVYLLTKKLFGKGLAIVASSLLILEPFFLAYQRFVTTDALQADFGIISVLMFLVYLQGKSRWYYLIGSGIFFGLATASKIPALFVSVAIVIWIIVIELGYWQPNFNRRGWLKQFIDLTLWSITTVAVIVLIWPTLWVNPGETLQRIYLDLLEESARGNFFFLGEVTDKPGIAFYPLILAYRLSPILQIGILFCLLSLIIPKFKTPHRCELIGLLIVTVVVLAFLSASDSKIDRYVVMVIPELAILAASGYLQIFHWGKQITRLDLQPVQPLLLICGIQAAFLIGLSPYYVAYYNPLLGGATMGQKLFLIGNGEGIDQAANLLNQAANFPSLKVASWYGFALKPYFQGGYIGGWTEKKLNLLKANRVIIYINQIQRNLPDSQFMQYFLAQQPLHTISLSGIEYAKVYPGFAPLPEDLANINHPLSLVFGDRVPTALRDRIRLLGYDLHPSQLTSNNQLSVTLYWEFLQSPPTNWEINLSLKPLDQSHTQTQKIQVLNGYIPLSQIPPGTIIRDVHQLTLDQDTLSTNYNLTIEWVTPDGISVKMN